MQRMHKLKPSGLPNRDRESRLSSRFQEEETHLRPADPLITQNIKKDARNLVLHFQKSVYFSWDIPTSNPHCSTLCMPTIFNFPNCSLKQAFSLKRKLHNWCHRPNVAHDKRFKCVSSRLWSFGVCGISVCMCVVHAPGKRHPTWTWRRGSELYSQHTWCNSPLHRQAPASGPDNINIHQSFNHPSTVRLHNSTQLVSTGRLLMIPGISWLVEI